MAKRKRITKTKKKQRAERKKPEDESLVRAPHSFVIIRGIVGTYVRQLMQNWRMVMSPYTAAKLKNRRTLSVKDYIHNAGCLHVSHMCIFTRGALNINFKLLRLPRGPTLTFRVHNYVLAHDVISSIKKPYNLPKLFEYSPLVVCNNFSSDAGKHVQLMASMFQNMFPTINVATVKLSSMKRVVMLDYNSESGLVEFRHYAIRLVPTEINRGIKKIVTNRVPNLGKFSDMADLVDKAGLLSESEGEGLDGEHNKVDVKRESQGNNKSSIRLVELGPRMTLQLIKVESGVMDGEIIYHSIEQKSEEEVDLIRASIEYKRKLKEKRKKQQKQNVKKKLALKEANKKKSLRGMGKDPDAKNEKEDETDDENAGSDEGEAAQREQSSAGDSDGGDTDAEAEETKHSPKKHKKIVKFKTSIKVDKPIKRLQTKKRKNK